MLNYLLRTKDNCFYNLSTDNLKSTLDPKEGLVAKRFVRATDLSGAIRYVAVDYIADIAPVALKGDASTTKESK